jgi:hypothetical protein
VEKLMAFEDVFRLIAHDNIKSISCVPAKEYYPNGKYHFGWYLFIETKHNGVKGRPFAFDTPDEEYQAFIEAAIQPK